MVQLPAISANPLAPSQANAGFWASFATKSDEDKVMLQQCLNGECKSLADMIGKTIAVEHVCVKMVDLENDESGEVVSVPRMVLITDKGERYTCTSDYAWKSMREIMDPMLYGPPPWKPALLIECNQHSSGKNRRFFTLTATGRAKK